MLHASINALGMHPTQQTCDLALKGLAVRLCKYLMWTSSTPCCFWLSSVWGVSARMCLQVPSFAGLVCDRPRAPQDEQSIKWKDWGGCGLPPSGLQKTIGADIDQIAGSPPRKGVGRGNSGNGHSELMGARHGIRLCDPLASPSRPLLSVAPGRGPPARTPRWGGDIVKGVGAPQPILGVADDLGLSVDSVLRGGLGALLIGAREGRWRGASTCALHNKCMITATIERSTVIISDTNADINGMTYHIPTATACLSHTH